MKKSIFEAVVIFIVFILLMNLFSNHANSDDKSLLTQPWFYALVGSVAAVIVDKILDKWFASEKYERSAFAQLLA